MTVSTARRQAVARRHLGGASAPGNPPARHALAYRRASVPAFPQRCATPLRRHATGRFPEGWPPAARSGRRAAGLGGSQAGHAAPAPHRCPPTHLVSTCITRFKRPARRALTKPTQARRLRRAIARITGRYAPLEPLPMSSDSHPRPGSMTQLARA
ncbi:hypothetical protein IB62_010205 [Xanthomonas euvesicatoria]|nr:hypothetical protein IB62_010205 [Xanthomonas euvesicatoria]